MNVQHKGKFRDLVPNVQPLSSLDPGVKHMFFLLGTCDMFSQQGDLLGT